MSILAKRISGVIFASKVLHFSINDLPFVIEGLIPARQLLKRIEEHRFLIERDRSLILSEDLPPTYPATDRPQWEYDVRANTERLFEKCHEMLRIALERQKEIRLSPTDDRLKRKVEWEMRGFSEDIGEIGKKLARLSMSIDEVPFVELDVLRLLSQMHADGREYVSAEDFYPTLTKNNAVHQQWVLIKFMVDKGFLKPAPLSSERQNEQHNEQRWIIIADKVDDALAKPAAILVPLNVVNDPPPPAKAQLDSLEPAEQKAYLAFQYAESKQGRRLEDKEAHEFLNEEGIAIDSGDIGILNDYELPAFDTWCRQLRTARRMLGEQKNKRRGSLRTSRSIVKGSQIESQKSKDA